MPLPFATPEARLAKLRPLDSRRDVVKAIGHGNNAQAVIKNGCSIYFGEQADRHPDGISMADVVESIRIETPFPERFKFYGFHLGLLLASAQKLISSMGLQRRSENLFCGKTPDGFEIQLGFRPRDDSASDPNSRLATISLSQIHPDGFLERRQALHKRLFDEAENRTRRASAWKYITDDDDAMLMDWARHCKPWDNYAESEFVKYAEWLRSASADERHMAALVWNWDYGLAPLLWIVRRSDCDVATALHVFMGCQPSYYLKFCGDRERVRQESSHALEGFDLMMEVKAKLDAGFHRRSAIAYDPSRDLEILSRYKPTPEQMRLTMPDASQKEYSGRRICWENNFDGLSMPQFRID